MVIICRPCYGPSARNLQVRLSSPFFSFCTSACAHPRFHDFPTHVHAFVINRDNVKWCRVVQRARYPHSHHNRDGCALARARMSRFLRVEARSVMHAHRWLGQRAQLMLWSRRLSVIPSESPALQWALEGSHVDVVRRSHGGGGCSHQLRAQVHGGAVIKFSAGTKVSRCERCPIKNQQQMS